MKILQKIYLYTKVFGFDILIQQPQIAAGKFITILFMAVIYFCCGNK